MILLLQCSESHRVSVINFWISSRMTNVVNPSAVTDAILIFQMIIFEMPFNFNGILKSTTVHWTCRHPPRILEIDQTYAGRFCLTTDKVFCFSQNLSRCYPKTIFHKSEIHVTVVFSEMNLCSKSGFINVPNFTFKSFTGSPWVLFKDLNHGENRFHKMSCVRRYLEIVFSRRFCILLTFVVTWRTDSVCKGFHPNFTFLGNMFSFAVPGSSRGIAWVFWFVFFMMRRFSPSRRCIEGDSFNTYPAVEDIDITRLLMQWHLIKEINSSLLVATWTQLFLFWSCILFAIGRQLVKLTFLVQQVELKSLNLKKWWRRLFHSSRSKFPLVIVPILSLVVL